MTNRDSIVVLSVPQLLYFALLKVILFFLMIVFGFTEIGAQNGVGTKSYLHSNLNLKEH